MPAICSGASKLSSPRSSPCWGPPQAALLAPGKGGPHLLPGWGLSTLWGPSPALRPKRRPPTQACAVGKDSHLQASGSSEKGRGVKGLERTGQLANHSPRHLLPPSAPHPHFQQKSPSVPGPSPHHSPGPWGREECPRVRRSPARRPARQGTWGEGSASSWCCPAVASCI